MDWDSPTTKKHIAEAKAQGCELLGEGRKTKYQIYRIYQLPCGHQKEMQAGDMRQGLVSCQICLDIKLADEANAQGCELLGIGKDYSYRIYRLKCGHEQEVQPGKMRTGGFGCKACIKNRLIAEAESQGCVVLGEGNNNRSSLYRLECGHKQSIETRNMRLGQFHCQSCLNSRLSVEAESKGCVLMGKGKSKNYRIYRLPCGHEQQIQPERIRNNRFRCQTCLDNRLEKEAAVQGCILLEQGKSCHTRIYRLSCGHQQEIETGNMRRGEGWFQCRICLKNKLDAEAEAQGCVLLEEGRNANFHTYQLACGHEQEVTTRNMRLGNFSCQVCEEWAFTQPSKAYLLHIKVGPNEWLKLGFAKNIDFRVTQYGLPPDSEVSVLKTMLFDTGKEAQIFEKSLHKKHHRKRLKAADMASFHSKSGQTECYPLTMIDRLMEHFRHDIVE